MRTIIPCLSALAILTKMEKVSASSEHERTPNQHSFPTSTDEQSIAFAHQIDSKDENLVHDPEDEPMVYVIPRDYASNARAERARLLSEGVNPESVILQSELCNYVPRGPEGEDPSAFAQRYVETMNGMAQRGVRILNDVTTGDVAPSEFGLADGRWFNVGEDMGTTKREYREFGEWFASVYEMDEEEAREAQVPERFRRFEQKYGEGEEEEDGGEREDL